MYYKILLNMNEDRFVRYTRILYLMIEYSPDSSWRKVLFWDSLYLLFYGGNTLFGCVKNIRYPVLMPFIRWSYFKKTTQPLKYITYKPFLSFIAFSSHQIRPKPLPLIVSRHSYKAIFTFFKKKKENKYNPISHSQQLTMSNAR